MFNLEEKISVKEATAMNPVVLAFVGDAVYSLYIREKLAFNHDLKTGELNRLAVSSVRASAQAQRSKIFCPFLPKKNLRCSDAPAMQKRVPRQRARALRSTI